MSVQTMAAVWRGSQHGGSALLMMLAIADFSDDKGFAFPAVSTLAEKTRMKPRNAHYLLSELRKSGELVVKIGAGRKGTNLYRIALDRLGVQPVAGVQAFAGCNALQGGAALQCAKPLQPIAPEPSGTTKEPPDTSLSRPHPKFPKCPHDLIVRAYHEILPELPAARLMDAKGRKPGIEAFWKWLFTSERTDGSKRATNADEALQFVRKYFERARSNGFVMGLQRGAGHDGWRASLDYLLSDKGKIQIIEKTEAAQ